MSSVHSVILSVQFFGGLPLCRLRRVIPTTFKSKLKAYIVDCNLTWFSTSASQVVALWRCMNLYVITIIIIIIIITIDPVDESQRLKTKLAGVTLVQFGGDQKRTLESNRIVTLDSQ